MERDNGIELTPDFGYLFDTFAREARLRADMVVAELPEPSEAQVAFLRVMHAVLVPLNVCAQSIHNREAVDKFRALIHEITQGIEVKANEIESAMAASQEEE